MRGIVAFIFFLWFWPVCQTHDISKYFLSFRELLINDVNMKPIHVPHFYSHVILTTHMNKNKCLSSLFKLQFAHLYKTFLLVAKDTHTNSCC